MDSLPTDLKARYTVADYRLSIRAAVRGLWRGEYDLFDFVDLMRITITRGFKAAWDEGARQCDVYPEEYTEQEFIELDDRINGELLFAPGFGRAVILGNRANKGLLRPQLTRAELWVKRYQAVKNRAMVLACKDRKLAWRLGAREHCTSCLKLADQVRRASVWEANDIYPQHPTKLICMLSAGGVSVCGCKFEPTDEPCTRGRLPSLP